MNTPMKRLIAALPLLPGAVAGCASSGAAPRVQPATMQIGTPGPARAVCTRERARAWADSTGWLIGSNFVPSTAINQLEMWQAATFDPLQGGTPRFPAAGQVAEVSEIRVIPEYELVIDTAARRP